MYLHFKNYMEVKFATYAMNTISCNISKLRNYCKVKRISKLENYPTNIKYPDL